ncbi:MAG: ComEC/Rec2 family competence protein [Lachnospiraceae bacterium]|nr:ComEC/Rec2 family competence protein [Lachnospiraceae bacterium]
MKRPLFAFCLFFLLTVRLGLGILGPPEDPYEKDVGKHVFLGTVEKKEFKKEKQVFFLRHVVIDGNEDSTEIENCGLICVTDGDAPEIGARVLVRGDLWLYPVATNPGEFDMRKYYLCQGYGARLNVWDWKHAGGSHDKWREGLWRIRCALGSLYDRLLPEEDAAVMKAMVLGDKGDLSTELKELYQSSGISHILAISGLHISLLGMGLYRLLRKASLPILPSVMVSLFFLVNYAILCGAGTSTLRAVTMFGLMAAADAERRSYDLPTALALSAASTTVTNPYLLLTGAFWLSYAAVCGVAMYAPAVAGELRAEDKRLRKFLQALGSSLGATVFTLPLILKEYYAFPLYGVLLNLLVIPLMSVLMISGLIMLPLGALSIPLGVACGLICHLILSLYRIFCLFFSELPGSVLITGCPSDLQFIAAYAIFGLVILADAKTLGRLLRRFPVRGKAGPVFWMILKAGVSALAIVLLMVRLRPVFALTMLDVGQGDGLCVETEEGCLMIDGGSTSKEELYKYQLGPFLKYRGISRVDYWFLSHPDRDHVSGLKELLADEDCGIRVGALVLPQAFGAEEDFAELCALAAARGTAVVYFAAGDRLHFGELTVESLHPVPGYVCEDVNEYSQILRFEVAGFTAVLGGDATAKSEAEAIENMERGRGSGGMVGSEADGIGKMDSGREAEGCAVDVMKLNHHGSRTSTSQEWLNYLAPRVVLISCGADNPYGHPHEEVLARVEEAGCGIFRTDQDGAVTVTLDPSKGYSIKTYLP